MVVITMQMETKIRCFIANITMDITTPLLELRGIIGKDNLGKTQIMAEEVAVAIRGKLTFKEIKETITNL